MIDSVSSLMSAIATPNNAGNLGDHAEGDPVFMNLLNAIAGSLNSPNSNLGSTLQAAVLAAANEKLPECDLLGGINSAQREQSSGLGLDAIPAVGTKKDDNSLAAMEMVLALLSAAASRLQPWQIKLSDSGTPEAARGGGENGNAKAGVRIRDLAEEFLSLPSQDRLAFLQRTLEGQGALQVGDARQPSSQMQAPKEQTAEETVSQPEVAALAAKTRAVLAHERAESPWRGLDALADSVVKQVHDGTKSQGHQQGFSDPNGQNSGGNPLLGQITDQPEMHEEKTFSLRDQASPADRVSETINPFQKPGDVQLFGSAVWPRQGGEVSAANALATSVVEQIARKAQFIASRGRSGLSIQLEPQELGKVRVYVSMGSGGLHVKLAAEASDTRQIIQSSLPQLKTAFESQGLRVDRFDVTVASNFSGFNSQQDNAQRQASAKSQSPDRYLWGDDADVDEIDSSEVRRPNSLVDYRI